MGRFMTLKMGDRCGRCEAMLATDGEAMIRCQEYAFRAACMISIDGICPDRGGESRIGRSPRRHR